MMNNTLIGPYITLLKKNEPYRNLWLSQVVSLTGDWFNLIATTTLVATLSGSGLAIGGVFIVRLLPRFIFSPVVGVVADRFNRRKILLISDILRIFVVLGFLLVKTSTDIWLLYTLIFVQLSISSFFDPTRSALMPDVVAEEDLVTANTLDGVTWSSMLAIGAALGGLATALLGMTTAFILDSLTFALSAWFVYRVQVKITDPAEIETQSGFRSYIDGLRYLWQQPRMLVLTFVKGAAALSFAGIDVAQVDFAENIFPLGKNGAATLGLIYMVIGLGTGLAPLIGKQYSGQNQRLMYQVISWSFLLSFVGFMGVAWAPNLPLFLFFTFFRGGGSGTSWVYSSTLLQLHIPSRYRGRVFAFDFMVFTFASVISTLAAGYAFDLGLNSHQLTFWLGVVAGFTLIGWLIYLLVIQGNKIAET